ncbi:hypothetical protein ACHAXR_005566 [Thalassiosira sp. AJA248-18]
MPTLYLFNRRTLLAGDDLQLPSLAWGSVSAAQLFLFLPYLLYCTIELVLTSPSTNGDDADDGWPDDNSNTWVETTGRRLNDLDDYFESIESNMPSMQSNACRVATSGFTNFKIPYLILLYLVGMAVYSATSLLYEQRIFQLSSLGTPTMDLQLRAPLKELIEFKMTFLAGFNSILLIYGLTGTFICMSGYLQCFPTFWWIVWFVLFLTQTVQCLLILTTLVSLWRVSPAPPSSSGTGTETDFYHRHADTLHTHNNIEMAEEMWQSRCEGCCRILAISTCFLFGGKGIVSHAAEGGGEKFYGDIARALADYFADFGDGRADQRGLDVVPSDVGLGFVMLRHIQAQRKMLAQRDTLQQTSNYGSRSGSSSDVSSAARENNIMSVPSNRTTLLFRWNSGSRAPEQGGEDSNSLNDHTIAQPEEAYGSFSRKVLSPSNPDDYVLLEEGARFARHQLAIYTWILYYFQFPVSGTFRLISQSLKAKLKCKNIISSETSTPVSRGTNYEPCSDIEAGDSGSNSTVEMMNQETIVGDNFLNIHEATMLAHAGLEKSDIAYASFEAGFYETPYCIIIDRKWKSIVLSIRGSLTLEDCVVDVLLDPSPLDALGEKYGFSGAGQYCHGGVLECTNWLHEDLMRHKILQKLLLGEHAEFSDYTLRIVGHSLGAGIGVILSLMLRNTYPSLRCLCYSPPGGLLTWKLAKECSEFVNSFILDSDIIPRLSVDNMERLRDEVLHLIARVKLSKYEIAQRIFWHGLCGEVELGDLDFLIQQNEDMLYPHDGVPDSDFARQLQQFENMQRERRSNRGVARSIALYPPGKITHLVKTGQSKKCLHGIAGCITCGASNAGSDYTPIQKENDDFNEIEISPTLWTDHFPNRVCNEIERIAKRFGIDTTLGSPSEC